MSVTGFTWEFDSTKRKNKFVGSISSNLICESVENRIMLSFGRVKTLLRTRSFRSSRFAFVKYGKRCWTMSQFILSNFLKNRFIFKNKIKKISTKRKFRLKPICLTRWDIEELDVTLPEHCRSLHRWNLSIRWKCHYWRRISVFRAVEVLEDCSTWRSAETKTKFRKSSDHFANRDQKQIELWHREWISVIQLEQHWYR